MTKKDDGLYIDVLADVLKEEPAKTADASTVDHKAATEQAVADAVAKVKKDLEAEHAKTLHAEKAETARERAARLDAERLRDEKAAEARQFAQGKDAADLSAVSNALHATKAEITAAKQAYVTAFEAQDPLKMADAQERIATASAYLTQLDAGKNRLEAELESRRGVDQAEPKKQSERQLTAAEQFEEQLTRFTSATQAWFRKNPAYLTNPKNILQAQLAHVEAVDSKLVPDTPEYFAAIEEQLGIREAAEEDGEEGEAEVVEAAPAAKPRAKSPSVAAPVSRNTKAFSSRNLQGSQVRLSAYLKDTAEKMFPEDAPAVAHKKYATNARTLIQKGDLPSNFLD